MLLCAVKGLSHWNNFFIIFFFEGPTVSNYIYTLNCMYFCCWLISTYLRSFNYNLNDNLSLNYDLNDERFQFMSPNYNLNDKSWSLFTQISFIQTVMCFYDPPKKLCKIHWYHSNQLLWFCINFYSIILVILNQKHNPKMICLCELHLHSLLWLFI